jgi:hypothetical protein
VLQLLDVPRAKAALLRPVALGSSSDLLVGQKVGGGTRDSDSDPGGRWLAGSLLRLRDGVGVPRGMRLVAGHLSGFN